MPIFNNYIQVVMRRQHETNEALEKALEGLDKMIYQGKLCFVIFRMSCLYFVRFCMVN